MSHRDQVVREIGKVRQRAYLMHDEEVPPDHLEEETGEPRILIDHRLQSHARDRHERRHGTEEFAMIGMIDERADERHGNAGDDAHDDGSDGQ